MKKTKVIQLVLLTTALTLAQQEGFSQNRVVKKQTPSAIQKPKTKKDSLNTKQAQFEQPRKKPQKDSIPRSKSRIASTSTNSSYGAGTSGKILMKKRSAVKTQPKTTTSTASKPNVNYSTSSPSKTYSSPSSYSNGGSFGVSRGGFGGRSSSSAS